jgi:glycosyltransferase involved in cell wall biosynthesis
MSVTLKLGLALEHSLGHTTHAKNLQAALAADRLLNPELVELPYHQTPGAWAKLPGVRSNWSLRASLGAYLGLRGRRFDALFFHTQVTSLLSAGLLRQTPGLISLDATPLQYDRLGAHYGHTPGSGKLEAVKARLNQRAFSAARGLITWSQWAKDSLITDYGVPGDKIFVIPPGVDIAAWDAARALRRPRAADAPLHVLFVGGDFVRKGGDTLLAAFARLPQAVLHKAHLHLVTQATELTPPAQIPHLTVHNGVTPNSERLRTLFAEADLFVFPTRADCLPQAVLEAMAAGLPVITTAVAALPEVIAEDETGKLVAPGDEDALAQALEQLLTDHSLRQRLGQSARQEALARFDAATNYPRILGRLKGLTQK